jgi:hypothetical protein
VAPGTFVYLWTVSGRRQPSLALNQAGARCVVSAICASCISRNEEERWNYAAGRKGRMRRVGLARMTLVVTLVVTWC